LDFERREIFDRAWLFAGHASEVTAPGSWTVAPLSPAGVVLVRGADLELRAFFNVCRHRAAPVVSGTCGRDRELVCRYHGWRYRLDGVLADARGGGELTGFDRDAHGLVPLRVAEHRGLVFVSSDANAPALDQYLAEVPEHLAGIHLHTLRLGRRVEHRAAANWKLLVENFQESHHFPGVHPALERLTPATRSSSFVTDGPWLGGTMELRDGAETVSLDGERHGRPLLGGTREADRRRIRDYFLWPNLLLSVQPDYLLTYRILPLSTDESRITADIYFHTAAFSDDFAPRDVYEFWDKTNAEDRDICEKQQLGIASPAFERARYVKSEDGVHAFDRLLVRTYRAALDEETT